MPDGATSDTARGHGGTGGGHDLSVNDTAADRRRFEAVFTANADGLLAYALRRAPSRADAADVVAETMLVAWRRLDDVPPGDEARLWLYGVARRVLANHSRGHRRRQRLGERLRDVMSHQPISRVSDTFGDDEDVRAALAHLPDDDREILRLVAWEGLSGKEIAAVLDISSEAVRTRLHRARRRLCVVLAQHSPALSVKRESQ